MSYSANKQWEQLRPYGVGAAPTFTDGVMQLTSPDTSSNRAVYRMVQAKSGDKIVVKVFARAISGQGRIYMNLTSLPGTYATDCLIKGNTEFRQYVLEYVVPTSYSQVDVYIGIGCTYADVGSFEAYCPEIFVNGMSSDSLPVFDYCLAGDYTYGDIRMFGQPVIQAKALSTGDKSVAVYSSTLAGDPFFSFATLNPRLRLVGDTNDRATFGLAYFGDAAANGPTLRTVKSRATSMGAFAVTQQGDALFAHDHYGDTGSAYARAARVEVVQDGALSGSIIPGRWQVKVSTPAATDLTSLVVDSTRSVTPGTDNIQSLGKTNLRWSVVYAGTGTISTSDANKKTDISSIPDEVLDAWSMVDFCQYRFKDAVSAKGADARLHIGVIAQDVKEKLEKAGIDPFLYGLLCYDKWEATPQILSTSPAVYGEDAEGNPILLEEERTVELQPAQEAGSLYSIRYEEALALETALLRRTVRSLEERLAALEGK